MSSIVLLTVIMLSLLGLASAVILYFVAQKFKIVEDPRIDLVTEVLPGANCAGCGYTGCRALAEMLVKSESFEGLNCPVGGGETMIKVADILGRKALAVEPKVAVLRCNGTPENCTRTSFYDGATNCRVAHALYGGYHWLPVWLPGLRRLCHSLQVRRYVYGSVDTTAGDY